MEAGPRELYHDLNFQNGDCWNKTKHDFPETCIVIMLLENSVHKKYFVLSLKSNQSLDYKSYKQVVDCW